MFLATVGGLLISTYLFGDSLQVFGLGRSIVIRSKKRLSRALGPTRIGEQAILGVMC